MKKAALFLLATTLAVTAIAQTSSGVPPHAEQKFIKLAQVVTKPSSMVEKYNGFLMQVSKATPDIYYLLLRGQTYAEKPEDKESLHDKDFTLAIQETEGKPIYELIAKKGALSHKAIDSLNGQTELRKLNLAGNRTIDDEACKKIAAYLPRLQNLNLYGTSISDEGLTYLLDVQELRSLHVFDTKVTWNGANEFRAKMESISGNDDLEITAGHGTPPLGSIKHGAFLKATYQKNVDLGRLDPNYIDKYPEVEAEKGGEKKYEEDLEKEATDPVLNLP